MRGTWFVQVGVMLHPIEEHEVSVFEAELLDALMRGDVAWFCENFTAQRPFRWWSIDVMTGMHVKRPRWAD